MSVNKTILLGHIASPVVLKKTNSNKDVVNLIIVTSESWTDKNRNRQQKSEYHNITVMGKKAVFVAEQYKQGDSIYIEGKNQTVDIRVNGINQKIKEVLVDNQGDVQSS